jgi:polyhydroxybutyrate depolymerase
LLFLFAERKSNLILIKLLPGFKIQCKKLYMRNCPFIAVLFVAATLYSCKKNNTPAAANVYRFNEKMTVDGLERTYTLNLPPTYYEAADFSVIIAMHGGGGSANQFESTCKLTEKANAANFIVVYPEGVQSSGILKARSWNAGGCCDYAVAQNINDVKFISLLIDKLVSTYKINHKKIYATGHSNGGMLAYRLACELSGKIAAIAPNGCTMVASTCNPARPVPVLHMHSVLDNNVPYQGGIVNGTGTQGVYMPPLDSVMSVWSLKNTCINTAQVVVNDANYKFTKWTNCNGNVSIQYYLTKDGGHGWPGGLPGGPNSDTPSTVINANNLIWDFFQQYQLP